MISGWITVTLLAAPQAPDETVEDEAVAIEAASPDELVPAVETEAPPTEEAQPEPLPEPTAAAEMTDEELEELIAERAKRTPSTEPEPERPPGPVRRAVVLTMGAGYAGCSKDWCQGYRGGFGGMLEAGLRFSRIMPVAGWHGGTGPYDGATLDEEVGVPTSGARNVKTNVLGAGVWLFPLGEETKRRIDPHFGVKLGVGWVKMDYTIDRVGTMEERLRRGVATLGGGIDGFVTDHVSLGFRVDAHVMFGGEYCRTLSDGGASVRSCAQSEDVESRGDPRDWPLPFSALVQLRYAWPHQIGKRRAE